MLQATAKLTDSCSAALEQLRRPSARLQDHEKFQSVAEEEPLLFSRQLQMGEEKRALPMKLGEAVAQGIIANQTLAYFIGRTFTFLKRVGLNPEVRLHSCSPAVFCGSFAGADDGIGTVICDKAGPG